MYTYIYDGFVNQKKFDNTLARIETRITDLGLNGKIIRVGLMTSAHDIVYNEIRKGALTIIAVGNNKIFNEALDSIAHSASLSKNVVLGFIPIGKENNEIADLLGIGYEEGAGDILSARRITKLDLGKANNHFFLTQAQIQSEGSKIEIDENYTVELNEPGEILVLNLPILNEKIEREFSNAEDGKLELYIQANKAKKILAITQNLKSQSFINFQSLNIINEKKKLLLDKSLEINTPAKITIANEKINLIVGKGRGF